MLVLLSTDGDMAYLYPSAEEQAADRHWCGLDWPPPDRTPPRRIPLPHAQPPRTRIYSHEGYSWRECQVTTEELADWLQACRAAGWRLTDWPQDEVWVASLWQAGAVGLLASHLAAGRRFRALRESAQLTGVLCVEGRAPSLAAAREMAEVWFAGQRVAVEWVD